MTVRIHDNGGTAFGGVDTSAVQTFTITVTAVNDGPANTVPRAQTAVRNTAKVFSSGNGNQISFSDADAASSTVQAQLIGTNGTVTLPSTTGLTFTAGANGTANMTIRGTLSAVNAALNGLSFTPTAGFSGVRQSPDRQQRPGEHGHWGTLTDTDTVAITVVLSYFDAIFGTCGTAQLLATRRGLRHIGRRQQGQQHRYVHQHPDARCSRSGHGQHGRDVRRRQRVRQRDPVGHQRLLDRVLVQVDRRLRTRKPLGGR